MLSSSSTDVTTSQLLLDAPDPHRPGTARYRLRLAGGRDDVLAAAALRDQVFRASAPDGSRTTGSTVRTPGPAGLDLDEFDDYCDHLLVHHGTGDPADPVAPRNFQPSPHGDVVATYRLLPPHANDAHPRRAGLYSATEFDITPLESLLDRTVEAGRACVHPDHRNSTPISLLWGGIARYMALTGYRYLIGCASIPLDDGGAAASAFATRAAIRHAAPEHLRCTPLRPWHARRDDGLAAGSAGDLGRGSGPATLSVPPLIRAYLRLGAVICGEPAHDPEFGTADFLILLDLDRADPRYLRYFLGSGG